MLSTPYEIAFAVPVSSRSFCQVTRIMPDILALCLYLILVSNSTHWTLFKPCSNSCPPARPRAHIVHEYIRMGCQTLYIPSVKLLVANIFLWWARNSKVTSGDPSRIIRWTVMRDLKTTVHVESRSRFWSARKTSATPCSPECVATRMCSIYFDFGGAS